MRIIPFLICASAFVAAAALAQINIKPPTTASDAEKSFVEATYRENLAKYKENPHILVLPGLVADRKNKRVAIQAEGDFLSAYDPVEFTLVSTKSGHSYEALAISYAKPSDVHKALEFIGMTPGRPVDPAKLQFWPKGERVIVTVSCESAGIKPTRIENFILDKRTGKPIPEDGWMFVGSSRNAAEGEEGQTYAADINDQGSIASTYNEPGTVLDIPRKTPQKEYYGCYTQNPKCSLPTNTFIEIAMEPERKDGSKRIAEVTLSANAKPNGANVADLELSLTDDTGTELNKGADLKSVAEAFVSFAARGRDVFVLLKLDGKLSLKLARDLALALSAMETDNGIRVEPPPAGALYYKAFIPNENFRKREERLAQPWELSLGRKEGKLAATLTKIDESWPEGKDKPDLKAINYDISGPDALREKLETLGPGLPVILVFSPPAITVAELMSYLGPVQSAYPTIFVYLAQ